MVSVFLIDMLTLVISRGPECISPVLTLEFSVSILYGMEGFTDSSFHNRSHVSTVKSELHTRALAHLFNVIQHLLSLDAIRLGKRRLDSDLNSYSKMARDLIFLVFLSDSHTIYIGPQSLDWF